MVVIYIYKIICHYSSVHLQSYRHNNSNLYFKSMNTPEQITTTTTMIDNY